MLPSCSYIQSSLKIFEAPFGVMDHLSTHAVSLGPSLTHQYSVHSDTAVESLC